MTFTNCVGEMREGSIKKGGVVKRHVDGVRGECIEMVECVGWGVGGIENGEGGG